MELSSSNIKNFYILSKESFSYIFSIESFSYISENRNLHFPAEARKIKNNAPREKFLCFRKWKPPK